MKTEKFLGFALLFGVQLGLLGFAQAKEFRLNGSADEISVTINGEATHTEYRDETVSYSCTRSEFDGYQSVCHTEGGGESCGITPSGRQCFDVPGHEVCSSEPVYRDVPDTCYETQSVPYQVHDFYIENDVKIIAPASSFGSLDEKIDISQSDREVSLSAEQTSKKVLIYADVVSQEISFSGGTSKRQSTVTLRYADLRSQANPLLVGMSDLTATGKDLSFHLGKVFKPELLQLSVDFRRDRLIGKDKILIRDLTAQEYSLSEDGEFTKVNINFEKLGIANQIKKKKMVFVVKTSLNIEKQGLVNDSDVVWSTQKNLTVKLPK